MATAARLGRIVLILALLPGLLLAEGERLRVCLHALMGQEAACPGMQEASSSCCSDSDSGEPTLRDDGPCEGCCVELAGQARERAAPAPRSVSTALAVFALPPRLDLAALSLAVVHAPWARTWVAPASPPGRAPTPLRI